MPEPENSGRALDRLDKGLGAFDASRRAKPALAGIGGGAGEGYRLLAQMVGGVLGGLGIGWGVDHFAHTGPWGVLGGLVIGAGLSVYATVQTASRISARAAAGGIPPASPADGDEDED
ncbi:MAG: AtpZ/AtpI family protein [Caulobacteraceae bacterium]